MVGIVLKAGGTENNSGAIAGGAYGVEIYGGAGAVLNSGYINATNSGGYGVLLKSYGSVANAFGGYIGGNTAVSLLEGGTVTNAEGALIESNFSSGNAVAVNIVGASGTISNSGAIIANSASSTFAAVFLGAGGSVANTVTGVIRAGAYASAIAIHGGAGEVVNDGTIVAGVYAVDLASGGSLTNGGGIYGRVTISGDGGIVTNSGSIYDAGVGVSVGGGATVTNEAGGSIGGGGAKGIGVYAYGGAAIVNAGSLTGAKAAIKFAGAGDNTLTLQSGSTLSGEVLGSAAQGAVNALVLTGTGAANDVFVNFDTLTLQGGGSWRLGGASTIGETTLSSGTLALAAIFTTTLDQSDGSVVSIAKADKLRLYSASTIGGAIVGLGTLSVVGGETTIASNADLSVTHWSILGQTAQVAIDETLYYDGVFTAGLGAIVTVSSGPLVLSGTAAFAGVEMTGAQRIKVRATSSVVGLTIGGTGGFANKGVLTQSGAVVVGDGAGDATQLANAAGASWNIVNDSGIALGASPSSSIVNLGLFEKTAGTGVSMIAPSFDNAANVMVSSGTLDFQAAVVGAGVDTISGAATLEFDASVANAPTIDFQGAGGVLDLGSPNNFSGAINGFAASDAVELLGSWSISSYAQTSASQGELKLSNGAHFATLAFDGNFSGSGFGASASSEHTTITYA